MVDQKLTNLWWLGAVSSDETIIQNGHIGAFCFFMNLGNRDLFLFFKEIILSYKFCIFKFKYNCQKTVMGFSAVEVGGALGAV